MRLADFIATNREAILQEFEDFARTKTAVGSGMAVLALRDHAAMVLEAIAVDLRQPQTEAAQKSKSLGDATKGPDAPTTPAEHHGHDRRNADFTLDETIAEFRALRASVLRLWYRAVGAPADEEAVQDMVRFNEAIDEAIGESVTGFSREHARLERERQAEAEARRRMGEFLRTVSHELRTPLNAVSGHIRNLLEGFHGEVPKEQREVLLRIQEGGHRLLNVVDDLLNTKRIEEGSITFHIEDLAVGELLTELTRLLESRLREADVELSIEDWGESDVVIRADSDKLFQVLLNLVSNAVGFTPRGGRVWVTCEATETEVSLCVHDTGRGIPEDKLEKIFEPFVQLDAGNTRERGGSGLGLTISRNFIRGMGGDLSVRSELGKGSVFCVSVPRSRGTG